MRTAGIVLAGGRSSRMGRPKAALEWHGTTLLARTVSVLHEVVTGPVVVVRAPGQDLPVVTGVELVDDPVEGLGPMQGVAAGLAAVRDRAEGAFVCSTDLPFLQPAFVRRVLADLSDADLVLPVVRGFRQPLAAAYRTGLADLLDAQLQAGKRRMNSLADHCRALLLDEAALRQDPELARADPDLESVRNVNTAEEYEDARRR